MSITNLYEFIEAMNTECSLISMPPPVIPIKAFRVDGNNGLKVRMGCRDLKSCDYLKFKKRHLVLIEFSDLYQQFDDLRLVHNALDSSIHNTFLKERAKKLKVLSKDSESILKAELEQKISQSLNLITIIKKQLNIKNQKKIFLSHLQIQIQPSN